jgi:hypothetical protein
MTPGGALTTGPAVNPNIGYDPVKAFSIAFAARYVLPEDLCRR